MPKALKLATFIERSSQIHHDFYNYEKFEYINSKRKGIIICPIHGDFLQEPTSHMRGTGCPGCFGNTFYNTEKFIKEANEIHKNYYSYDNSIYCTMKNKIIITCPIHGNFNQTPEHHLKGYKCKECADRSYSKKEFIDKANKIHDHEFDYSEVSFLTIREKIKITCKKHGIFLQRGDSHLSGCKCPKCKKESKGEKNIRLFLENNNLNFECQKKFDSCFNPKTNYKLPFDFYLPDLNLLVEYDGPQHFHSISFFGGEEKLKSRIINDEVKNEFACKNEINLLRIDYKQIKNIEKILNNYITNSLS